MTTGAYAVELNMPTELRSDLPIRHFHSASAWERWLAAHTSAPGLWLKIAKKGSGISTVTYTEALDVALCYGWIDSQKRACDTVFFLQRFTPRKPKSLWSKNNVAKAETLITAGRMRAGGRREINAAKADGRWQAAYDSGRNMEPPAELRAALVKNRKAAVFFAQLDRANHYAVCWRVQTAKKPETRRVRVVKLVAMLARGEKIHP